MRNLCLIVLLAWPVFAQDAPVPATQSPAAKPADSKEAKEEIEQGIPITSELVRKSCSPCHKVDDKLRMSRISYRRTTPEGWQETIRRMASLNGVKLEPEDARQILRYLANNLGLAPEEAKPAAFEVEHRMVDYKYTADKDTEGTCIKCHSMGRVISQRRTKGEWELLIAMHRGYYPFSDFQAFRRTGPPQREPGPDGRPPDNRHPMDKAIAHLTTAFPLKTPEWSAWSANMRTPRLDGKWMLSGYQPGKGPVYGEVTIRAAGADGDFTTAGRLVYAKTGQTIDRAGKALVYTGYQWRGRSHAGDADSDGMREVMFVDRDMREIQGRWFTGAYEEIGIDVKLTRVGGDPVVAGLDRKALRTGATALPITIHGANFPAGITADAIDFGRGVRLARIVTAAPSLIQVELDVAKDAPIGPRDVFVAGAGLPGGAVVFDKIDSIKVRPQAGMARIGGINFPKELQQFEAIAYSNGPDGKPDTKDDLELGPVDVAWSIEEYTATFGDDDKGYVGALDDKGLFTPNVDGPNLQRRNHADNVGDVWVVATLNSPAANAPAAGGEARPPGNATSKETEPRPLRARAHLLVTVPLYMKWVQEVAP